jgi:thioredoxin-like negative regulator of GroEL
MAEKYRGRIKIGKMNIGDNLHLSTSLGVRKIPTLILFKEGKAVDRVTGSIPEDRLEKLIESSIQ